MRGGLRGALWFMYFISLAAIVHVGGACVVMPLLMGVLIILYVTEYFVPAQKGTK